MQFRDLVLQSYKTEFEKKLREMGYSAKDAEKYVEMSIEYPIENLLEEILKTDKQLTDAEVVSFMRMIQKAKGVDVLLSKSSRRKEESQTMVMNGRAVKFNKQSLTKKISSQFIGDDIKVYVPQHQLTALKNVLGTTPRIIVDLDKIPYINEIRFDVKSISGGSGKLVDQFSIRPLTDENDEYLGIVEIIIDPQLYGEAMNRAEIAEISAS